MQLPDREVRSEQKQARWAVVLAALSLPFLVAVYFQGPHWVLLVWLVGSTVGYIQERRRLSRALLSLLEQRRAFTRPAGVSWSA